MRRYGPRWGNLAKNNWDLMPSERPRLLSFIASWTSARKLNGVQLAGADEAIE